MIRTFKDNRLITVDSLREAFQISVSGQPVISLTGAGGKTTTIRRLAEEYVKDDMPVIITTTTHMLMENVPWMLLEPSMVKAGLILKREKRLLAGTKSENGKISMPQETFLKDLLEMGSPVLIEADGAKRLPIKVQGENEPVLLKETTHIINVYGLDALGKRLKDVCFRSSFAAKILKCSEEDIVKEKEIAKLAMEFKQRKAGESGKVQYHVLLNKADTQEDIKRAENICFLLADEGMTDITVTGMDEKEG